MKTLIAITLLTIISFQVAFSQDEIDTTAVEKDSRLNIYLDCSQCDDAFFKTNFTAVNYVNDIYDADVQILVTSVPTGSGGEEYNIRMFGKERYKYMNDTVLAIMPEYFTYDETRQALLDKIQLGLVPYLMKTPYRDRLTLSIDDFPVTAELKDPWNNWVFDISGTGSFSSQKFAESYSLSGSFYASKVTRQMKIESSNYFGFSEYTLSFKDDDTIASYTMSQQDISSSNLYVKSLGNHWGVGGIASFGKSEYSNLDFQLNIGPAAEYNIFSYDEASTRECRIMYSFLYEHSKYGDTTVYKRLKDDLFTHNLSMNFSYYEPWGTVTASAGGSAYANDISQFSVGIGGSASWQVSKGLSLVVSGSVGYCQNQRSLIEDIPDPTGAYMGEWQMEQGLSYSINIGISYRFGSKNNNSVNARFGF